MEINTKNFTNNYQNLCLYCDKTFPNIKEQENHVEREHKTILCKGKGSRKSERITKNNSSLENSPFPGCFHCNKKVFKSDDLDILFDHLLTCHRDVYFGCKCKTRKLDKISLANHKKHCKVAGDNSARKLNGGGDVTCDNLSENEDELRALPAINNNNNAILKKSESRTTKLGKNANVRKHNNNIEDEDDVEEYKIPLTRQKLKSSSVATQQIRSSSSSSAASTTKKSSQKANKLNDIKNITPSTAASIALTAATSSSTLPVKSQRTKPSKATTATVNVNSQPTETNVESSTQKVEPVNSEFDDDFYRNISQNIRENLSFHVDGKRDRLKNLRVFDQLSSSSVSTEIIKASKSDKKTLLVSNDRQIHESTNFESSTPFPALLTIEQYGFGDNRRNKFRRQITKNSWKWRWDLIKKYKYVNDGGKIVKKVKPVTTGLKDLSQLDMWTQLSMRSRYEKLKTSSSPATTTSNEFDEGLSESLSSRMIKTQNVEQLNMILNKRSPLEIDIEQREQTIIKMEPVEIEEMTTTSDDIELNTKNEYDEEDDLNENFDMLKMFGLERNENNQTSQPLLSGEWARPRCYICLDCGQKFDLMKNLNEHKNSEHPYIVTSHYEVVGRENLTQKLYKNLFLPKRALETSGFARSLSVYSDSKSNETNEASTSSDNSSKFSSADQKEKECSKCLKMIKYSSDNDIYQHILDCIEDRVWMQAKKRSKYRKSRRKSRKFPRKSRSSLDQNQKKSSSSPSNKDNTEGESNPSLSNPPTPKNDLTTNATSQVNNVISNINNNSNKKDDVELKINGKAKTNGNLSIKNFFRVSKTPVVPQQQQKLVVQMMEITENNLSLRSSLRTRSSNAANRQNDEQQPPKNDDSENQQSENQSKNEEEHEDEKVIDSKNELPQTSPFTPLSVCTPTTKSLNPTDPQLISPSSNSSLTSPTLSNSNVPKKKKKLNDCIAMLTCKIQEKLGVNFFDSSLKKNDGNEQEEEEESHEKCQSSDHNSKLLTEIPEPSAPPVTFSEISSSMSLPKPKAPSTSFQIASLLGESLCDSVQQQDEVIDLSVKKTSSSELNELATSSVITSEENVKISTETIEKHENENENENDESLEKEIQVPIKQQQNPHVDVKMVENVEMKSEKEGDKNEEKEEKEADKSEIAEKSVKNGEDGEKSIDANANSQQAVSGEVDVESSQNETEVIQQLQRPSRRVKAAPKVKTPRQPVKKAVKGKKVALGRRQPLAKKLPIKPENVESLQESAPSLEVQDSSVSEKIDDEKCSKIVEKEIEKIAEIIQDEKQQTLAVDVAVIEAETKNIEINPEDFIVRIPKRRIPNLKSILEKKEDSINKDIQPPQQQQQQQQQTAVKINNLKISDEERRAFEEQKNRIMQILNKTKQSNKKEENKTPKRKTPQPKKTPPVVRKKQKPDMTTTPVVTSVAATTAKKDEKDDENMTSKLEQTIKATNRVRCRRLSVVIDPIINLSNFQTKNRKMRLTNNSQQNDFYDLLTASEELFAKPKTEELPLPEITEKKKEEVPMEKVAENLTSNVEVKCQDDEQKKTTNNKSNRGRKSTLKIEVDEEPPKTPEPILVEDVLKPRAAKSQAIGLISSDKPKTQKKKPPAKLKRNNKKSSELTNSQTKSEENNKIEDSFISDDTVNAQNDIELKLDEKPATPRIVDKDLESENIMQTNDVKSDDKQIEVKEEKIDEKPSKAAPVVIATPVQKKSIKNSKKVKKNEKSTKVFEELNNIDVDNKSSLKDNKQKILESEKIESVINVADDEREQEETSKENIKTEIGTTFNPFTINEDSLFIDDDNDPSDKINDIVNNIINSSELQNDSETEKSESNATSFDDKNQNLPVCIICRRTFRNEKVYDKHCKTSTHIMKVERRQRGLAKKVSHKSCSDKAPSPILDDTKIFRTKGALKTFDNIVDVPVACKKETKIKTESQEQKFMNESNDKIFFDLKVEKKPEDMTPKDKDQLFDSLFNSLEANALSNRNMSKLPTAAIPPATIQQDSEIESSSTSWDLKHDADIEWEGENADNVPFANAISEKYPKKFPVKINKSKETAVSIPTKSLIMGKIFKKHRDREKQRTPQADAPTNKAGIKNSLDEIFDHLKNTSEIDDRVLTCPSPKTLLRVSGGTFSPNSSNSNDMLESASQSNNNNNNNNIYKSKTPEKSMPDDKKMKMEATASEGVKRMPRRRCAAKTKTFAETWSSDEYEELHDTEDIIGMINEIERRESIKKNKQQKVCNSTEESTQKITTATAMCSEDSNKKVDKKIQFVDDDFDEIIDNKLTKKRAVDTTTTNDGYKSDEEVFTSKEKATLTSKTTSSIKKRRMSCFVPSSKSTFEKETITPPQVFKMEKEVLKKFDKVNHDDDDDEEDDLLHNKRPDSEKGEKTKGKSKSQKQRKKAKNRIRNIAYDSDSDFELNLSKKPTKNKALSECMSSDEDDNESVITTKTVKSINTPQNMTVLKESTKVLPNDLKPVVNATPSNHKAAIPEDIIETSAISKACSRTKRHSSEKLYYWSSSSSDEDNQEQGDVADINNEEPATPHQQPEQHGWIVGDSHKKLVTLLAHAKIKNKIN